MNKQKKIIIWIMIAIIMIQMIAATNITYAQTPKELENLQIKESDIKNGGTCHLQFTWTGDPVQTIDFHFICYDPSSKITITVDQSSIGQEGAVNFPYDVSPYILSGTYVLYQIDVLYEDWRTESNYVNGTGIDIDVSNKDEDKTAPGIEEESIRVTQEGRLVSIAFNANDTGSGLYTASFKFQNSDDKTLSIWGHKHTEPKLHDYILQETSGGYLIENNIHPYDVGTYDLCEAVLVDRNGNEKSYEITGGSSIEIEKEDTQIPGINAIAFDTTDDVKVTITFDRASSTVDSLVFCFDSNAIPPHRVFVPVERGEIESGETKINKVVPLNAHLPNGTYTLSHISVRDTDFVSCEDDLTGIDEIVHSVNDLYKGNIYGSPSFEITGDSEDKEPPEVSRIEPIRLEEDEFTLIFEASDDLSGIRDVLLDLGGDFYLYGEMGEGIEMLEERPNNQDNQDEQNDPNNQNKWYKMTRKLPAGMPAGTFRVISLRIRDQAFNENAYSYDEQLLQNASFTVPVTVFTVTFQDWNETILKTEEVEYQRGGTPPSDPSREGYAFTGWDRDCTCVTSDLTITAQYEKLESPGQPTGGAVPPPSNLDNLMSRIAGDNRYMTAVELSKKAYEFSSVVVLATGENFPDALAGGVLASHYDAPLLLVRDRPDVLDLVLEEMKRLDVREVILLGGDLAISAEVEKVIRNVIPATRRIAGSNRYETAHLIAGEIGLPEGGHVFLASGVSYPDALSIGPVAAFQSTPVLLTHPDRLLPELEVALEELGVRRITLIGGPRAISPEVESILEERFILARIQGDAREDTALEIAKCYFTNPCEFLFSSGENFPDGLVGGYYAALNKLPLLLVRDRGVRASVREYLAAREVESLTLLGGPLAIGEAIERELAELLR